MAECLRREGPSSEPLLTCQSLCKNFGALAALSNVSFAVWPGEILGIGGPNGAGKTTLFDVITGLVPADSGKILLDGLEIQRHTPWTISHCGIGRTFQLNAGFDTLSVRENVLVASHFGFKNRIAPRIRFDKDSIRRAEAALDRVGLLDKADEIVKDMRVLDRKLLMLACVLSKQARLILLDEPVGGLNPEEIDEMACIVAELKNEGTSIILIEHVMRFLVQLSDRVMILHHGQKIYEGETGGLIRDKTVVEVYLGKDTADRMQHLIEDGDRHDSSAA